MGNINAFRRVTRFPFSTRQMSELPQDTRALGAGEECVGGDAPAREVVHLPALVDLLERFPDLFAQQVLSHLDPIDRTFLAQTGGVCRAALGIRGRAQPQLRTGTWRC